jgi:hypothetical protein
MREICKSGSEGGGTEAIQSFLPYQQKAQLAATQAYFLSFSAAGAAISSIAFWTSSGSRAL